MHAPRRRRHISFRNQIVLHAVLPKNKSMNCNDHGHFPQAWFIIMYLNVPNSRDLCLILSLGRENIKIGCNVLLLVAFISNTSIKQQGGCLSFHLIYTITLEGRFGSAFLGKIEFEPHLPFIPPHW